MAPRLDRSFSHPPRPGAPEPATTQTAGGANITNRTLSGVVILDGSRFLRCRFKAAALVYTGGAPPSFEGCSFEDVSFRFDGAAGRTLAFLKAMSAPSSGLAVVFKASFPRLFGH